MEDYIISTGFFKYNIILIAIFAIITLLVSFYAYRHYRLAKQKQLKLFMISFFSFFLAYSVRLVINLLILFKITDGMTMFEYQRHIIPLSFLSAQIYIILFTISFALLAYTSLRIDSKKALALIICMPLITLIMEPGDLYLFHILSSVMLIFIVSYYFSNYRRKPSYQSMIVMLAFFFLLFGQFSFIFSMKNGLLFIIGRLLELAAYLMILTNLLITLKK